MRETFKTLWKAKKEKVFVKTLLIYLNINHITNLSELFLRFVMVNFSLWSTENTSEVFPSNFSLCVNITDCPEVLMHAPEFMTGTLVRVVVLFTIATIAIIGNIATLLSIRKKISKSHSSVYWLIANLAVADIMVSFFCIVVDAVWMYTVQWLAGNIACKVIKFFQMFTLYLSTFILVVIAIDRYTAVKFPIQKVNSKQRSKRFIVIVWILSALFSLPQVRFLVIICRIRKLLDINFLMLINRTHELLDRLYHWYVRLICFCLQKCFGFKTDKYAIYIADAI